MIDKMLIGNKEFDLKKRTYIMGILNATPDSFSDGGKYLDLDQAMFHAEQMIKDGADIIDVGGESTRPGYIQISEEEEIERVTKVISKIKNNFDIPVSIDTYKSKVAREALISGADLVNDIWGLKYDQDMADVIAQYECPCCLMHNRTKASYYAFVKDVLNDLRECVTIAQRHGIKKEKIILDPGIGFAKTYEQNLELLNKLEQISALGFPVLLGTSRKSVIGLTLDLPVDQRVEGTVATSVLGVMKGCSFVRVHDVKENKRAVQMIDAIMREKE